MVTNLIQSIFVQRPLISYQSKLSLIPAHLPYLHIDLSICRTRQYYSPSLNSLNNIQWNLSTVDTIGDNSKCSSCRHFRDNIIIVRTPESVHIEGGDQNVLAV